MLNVAPFFMAHKAYSGRERYFDAFERYLRIRGDEKAAAVVNVWYVIFDQYGIPVENIVRLEAGLNT